MPETIKFIYKDIDCKFERDTSGNLNTVTDMSSVEQSIDTILLTPLGSRKFLPTFGSRLNSLLFETITVGVEIMIKTEVIRAINRWDPRVVIRDVTAIAKHDRKELSVVVIGYTEGLREFTYSRILSDR